MHVLYYHQYFNSRSGTGGTRPYEFARALVQRGHRVTVVCGQSKQFSSTDKSSGEVCRGNVDGIDIIALPIKYSNYQSLARRTWSFARFAILGARVALQADYDLLFASSTPLTAGIPGIVSKLARRKTFVFEVRDLWPELPRALGLKNPLLLWPMSFIEWLSYRACDAAIGLSPGIVEGILRRSRPDLNVTMVPNGCDLDLFKPGSRSSLRLEGVKDGDFVAAFTGAHGIANGLPALLDAASVLMRLGRTNIKLCFIGDGGEKAKLMERAHREGLDNCIFLDPIPKIRLAEILGQVDCGLMILANVTAFYYGTSPNKFFDYIAAGLPVVNNYPGWLADLIAEHKCGLAVPPDQTSALTDALVYLADHPEEKMKMGENARRLAQSSFARDRLSTDFVNFLEAVGGSPPS